MVTEFWSGWFDHWGERHHLCAGGLPTTRLSERTLDRLLAAGASMNFYMFHGGTNFGFMNGANVDRGAYHADVTSYDYDAPLDEAGDPTPKFVRFQKIFRKRVPGGSRTSLPEMPGRRCTAPRRAAAASPTGTIGGATPRSRRTISRAACRTKARRR